MLHTLFALRFAILPFAERALAAYGFKRESALLRAFNQTVVTYALIGAAMAPFLS